MKGRVSLIGLLIACSLDVCSVAASAASPAAPPAGYTIEEKYSQKSPDDSITVEQYVNKDTDEWKWQFWVRRQGTLKQLDPEPGLYPAQFMFSNDLKWIMREQKIGSGTSMLHLYRLTPQGFVRASRKPLGDLAWAYMKTRPDWRKLVKAPEYHDTSYLVEGFDEAYRDLGVNWPENRYLVIGLFGAADVRGRKPSQTSVVNGWRCRYDLETGKFDVPPVFARNNAKAVRPD